MDGHTKHRADLILDLRARFPYELLLPLKGGPQPMGDVAESIRD